MNRRAFIQIAAVAALPIALGIFPRNKEEEELFTISLVSNRKFGHLIRETASNPPTKHLETDYIIVGGGVAGIAAASQLKQEDFLLFEGGDRFGGTAASGSWKTTEFAMGAHYELAYPDNFGKEIIEFLQEIKVLNTFKTNGLYSFVDDQYLIKSSEQEQCFDNGELRADVLADSEGETAFYNLLDEYVGKMPLPTRKIAKQLHHLSEISFKSFLEERMLLSEELEQRISYQMLDDWGGTCQQVSALAGLHYYTCRPYEAQQVPVFSPPNGNAYFIEKMLGHISQPERFMANSFVRSVKETEAGVIAEVLSLDGTVTSVAAKGLVYAGQKHSLKYVMPQAINLFEDNDYAPWVAVNIVCKKGVKFDKWQNDVLSKDINFLGFVNSTKQKARSKTHDVLTAYYCFEPNQRQELVDIEKNSRAFIDQTISLIEDATDTDIQKYVEHVSLHLMGHAMAIPKPGMLNLDNVPTYGDRIAFAGADTGRLPLFAEALDSGLQAAVHLLKFKDKAVALPNTTEL